MNFRIGHGYDVHRLSSCREMIIGGVRIDSPVGILGHSDADVLLHAIIDALLGAAALGDIGRHFPDSAEEYRGISSMALLDRVNTMILEKGYSVSNIDATVVLQAPKLSQYIPAMIENIAGVLDISLGSVNIKATTEEGLGFTGCGDGVAAHAVVLLEKNNKG